MKRFFKQSFVTWQILGLALHPDRPVECGLYFTLTLNYLKTIFRDFADFSQTGVGVGCCRGWGWNWTLTHSVGELDTAVRREEATFSNYSRIVLRT